MKMLISLACGVSAMLLVQKFWPTGAQHYWADVLLGIGVGMLVAVQLQKMEERDHV